MPSAWDASIWPLSIDSIPARNSSARYPLDCSDSAITALVHALNLIPRISGQAKCTQMSCTRMGVLRPNSTNSTDGNRTIRARDSDPMHAIKPTTTAISMETIASCMVIQIP